MTMTDRIDERVTAAARRWQAAQPPPPVVPLDRLDEQLPGRTPWRAIAAVAAAAVVVVGGGALALDRPPGTATQQPPTSPRTEQGHHHLGPAVPWRDLPARHPDVRHREHGQVVTPYDRVSATGHVSGRAQPGDALRFIVTLESSTTLPLDPCPDYTIAFGTSAHTGQLNCAGVRFRDGRGRPVLPALKNVRFAMRVTVPDLRGRQKVLWTLDGPHAMPGFYGIVRVTRSP
jgi:hypothetical protein